MSSANAALEWQDYSIQGPFEELVSALEQWLDRCTNGVNRALEILHHGYHLNAQLVGVSTARSATDSPFNTSAGSQPVTVQGATEQEIRSSLHQLASFLPIGTPTLSSLFALPVLLGVSRVVVITSSAYPHPERAMVPRSLARQVLGAARLAVEHWHDAQRRRHGYTTVHTVGVAVQVDKADRQAWIGCTTERNRESQLLCDSRPLSADRSLHTAVSVRDALRLLLSKVLPSGGLGDEKGRGEGLSHMQHTAQGQTAVSARWTLTPAATIAAKGLGAIGLHASAVELWCTWLGGRVQEGEHEQGMTEYAGPLDLKLITAAHAAAAHFVAVRIVWRPGLLLTPPSASPASSRLCTLVEEVAPPSTTAPPTSTRGTASRAGTGQLSVAQRLLHILSVPAAVWHPLDPPASEAPLQAVDATGASTAHSLAYSPVLALTVLAEAVEGAKAHAVKLRQEVVQDLTWQRSQAQGAGAGAGELPSHPGTPSRGSSSETAQFVPTSASRSGTGHIARVRAWIADEEEGRVALGGTAGGSGAAVHRSAAAWSDEYIHAKASLLPELSAAEDLGALYVQYVADACDEWLDEEEAAHARARAVALTSSDAREILHNVSTGRDRLLQAVGPSITPSPSPPPAEDVDEEPVPHARHNSAADDTLLPAAPRTPDRRREPQRAHEGASGAEEEPTPVRPSPPSGVGTPPAARDTPLARTPLTAGSAHIRSARHSVQQALQAGPEALGSLLTTPHPVMPRGRGVAATLASVGGMFAEAMSTAALILGGPAAVLAAAEDASRYVWYPHVEAAVRKALDPACSSLPVLSRLLQACTCLALRSVHGFDAGVDLPRDTDTTALQRRQNVGSTEVDTTTLRSGEGGPSARVKHEASIYFQGRSTRLARFGPDFLGLPHKSALSWLCSAQLELDDALAGEATDARISECRQEVAARLAVVQKMIFCTVLVVWWRWTKGLRQMWEEATAQPQGSALHVQGLRELHAVLHSDPTVARTETATLLEQRLQLLRFCCEALLSSASSTTARSSNAAFVHAQQASSAAESGNSAALLQEAQQSASEPGGAEDAFVDAQDELAPGQVEDAPETALTGADQGSGTVTVTVMVPQLSVLQAVGAREAIPGLLRVLRSEAGRMTVTPVYAPALQAAPPVTADTALLYARQMSELGFSRVASPVRQQVLHEDGPRAGHAVVDLPPSVLHPALLQSDMGAFKAANSFSTQHGGEADEPGTGVNVHHFLRWYAPIHWMPVSSSVPVLPVNVVSVHAHALPAPEDPASGAAENELRAGAATDVEASPAWYLSPSAVSLALQRMCGQWDARLAPHSAPEELSAACGFVWEHTQSAAPALRLVPLAEHQDGQLRSWVSLWSDARPLPAARQRPLFNPVAAAEECLHALETMTVSEMLVQLISSAGESCCADGRGLSVPAASPEAAVVSTMTTHVTRLQTQAKGYCLSAVAVSRARTANRTGADAMEASVESALVRDAQLDLITTAARECAGQACQLYTMLGRRLAVEALFGRGSSLLLGSLVYNSQPSTGASSLEASTDACSSNVQTFAAHLVDDKPDITSILQRSKAGDRAILSALYPHPDEHSVDTSRVRRDAVSSRTRAHSSQRPTAPPGAERLHAPLAAYASRKLQFSQRYLVPGKSSSDSSTSESERASVRAAFTAVTCVLPTAAQPVPYSVSGLLQQVQQRDDRRGGSAHSRSAASAPDPAGSARVGVSGAVQSGAGRARAVLEPPDASSIVVTSSLPRWPTPAFPAQGGVLPSEPGVPITSSRPPQHRLIVRQDGSMAVHALVVVEDHL